jgi:hypothetical protein
LKQALTNFWGALRRYRYDWPGVLALWLSMGRRWFNPPPPRVQAGVHLNASAWEIAALDRPPAAAADVTSFVAGEDSHEAWEVTSLALERLPELTVNWLDQVGTERHLDHWQRALMAVCQRLPLGERHLVLAWPDEALWSAAITLAGPLTQEELQTWLPEELDAVLPCGLAGAAWDCFPVLPVQRGGPLPGSAWWSRLLPWRKMEDAVGRVQGDIMVRCWAMPVQLARALVLMSARLGLASLRVEPASLARARAARLPSAEKATRLSAVAAYGAACRRHDDGPDLLRRLHLPLAWRIRRWGQSHLPWLLAMAAIGSLGLALGARQAHGWQEETSQQEGRLRLLQSQLDEHKQRQQQQLRFRQQSLELARQQQARRSHNLQFVQALQGMAASLPPGVHWQRVNVRPHLIALQALATDSQAMTRWIAQWPDALPTGVQPQVQWQPRPEAMTDSPGQGAIPGAGMSMEIDVQLNLMPTPQDQE